MRCTAAGYARKGETVKEKERVKKKPFQESNGFVYLSFSLPLSLKISRSLGPYHHESKTATLTRARTKVIGQILSIAEKRL